MYCRRCGRQIPDDALNCPVCNTPTNGDYRPSEEDPSNTYGQNWGYSYSNPGRYDDPMPSQMGRQPGDRRGLAIASMVLGILSIVACCVPMIALAAGAAGIVLGILGVKSSGQGFAVAGIVLGVIGLVLGIGYLILSVVVYSQIDMNEIMNEMGMYY